MPKIRHLAIMCMDPQKLAKFYCEVFDMKVRLTLPTSATSSSPTATSRWRCCVRRRSASLRGSIISAFTSRIIEEIARRLKKWDVVGPEKRPADRTYAETRATDPEGNNIDLAEGGFDRDLSHQEKGIRHLMRAFDFSRGCCRASRLSCRAAWRWRQTDVTNLFRANSCAS